MPASPASWQPLRLASYHTKSPIWPLHGVIVMPQFRMVVVVILPAASTTCATYGKVPAVVGVPVMAPVVVSSVKPGGNDPEMIEKVYGVLPPLATSAEE